MYHPQLLSHIAIHLIYLQYPSVQLLFILGTLLAPLVDILWVPPRGSRVAAEVLGYPRGDRRCYADTTAQYGRWTAFIPYVVR